MPPVGEIKKSQGSFRCESIEAHSPGIRDSESSESCSLKYIKIEKVMRNVHMCFQESLEWCYKKLQVLLTESNDTLSPKVCI